MSPNKQNYSPANLIGDLLIKDLSRCIEAALPFTINLEQRTQIRKVITKTVTSGSLATIRSGHNWSLPEQHYVWNAVATGSDVSEIARALMRTNLSIEAELDRQEGRRPLYKDTSPVKPTEAPAAIQGRHHRDIIIEWANGREVQCSIDGVTWTDIEKPVFDTHWHFRLKPEPLPSPEELAAAVLRMDGGERIDADMAERIRRATELMVSPAAVAK